MLSHILIYIKEIQYSSTQMPLRKNSTNHYNNKYQINFIHLENYISKISLRHILGTKSHGAYV